MTTQQQTEEIAYAIWDFVSTLYEQRSPRHIIIYHHLDGTLHIKCEQSCFFSIRYYSCDKTLLEKVSLLAEKHSIEGKMYLHSSKDFLNRLDFTFSYS